MTLKRTWLDRAVGVISPRAEMRRLQYRAATRALVLHYEGASTGRRTENWRAPGAGPTAAGAGALSLLRNRSRDLVRNNPWARNAIETLETEVVGTGIVPKIVGSTPRNQAELANLWRAWAETIACDADALHDIYGLQALAYRTIAESGEVLIRRRMRRVEDGLPLPMQLQVLEPDFLDVSRDVVRQDGSRIVGGIEFNAFGRRVAYWLFPEHPGENFATFAASTSRPVPAENVLHLFRVERPGQVRGVPWGASAIVRLRDFDEYEDASLMRQKIAACFAVFVHDADSSPPGALDGVDDANKPSIERVYPGMIERLEPGKQVTFGAPPGVEGHDVYSRNVLRSIAAGFGTTYEAITGDWSNVNYSSARMGHLVHQRRIDAWRWRILVPRLCVPVWQWFLDTVDATLDIEIQGAAASWFPPRKEMLDPKTEVVATRTEIRAGLKSHSAALRERGEDPEVVFAEIAADRDKLDALDLIIESDARRPSNGNAGDPSIVSGNQNTLSEESEEA
jgi:lambda family phage portal protein